MKIVGFKALLCVSTLRHEGVKNIFGKCALKYIILLDEIVGN